MTVSREWPQTLRSSSGNCNFEINLDPGLCSTNISILPASVFGGNSSDTIGTRGATIHHIPIYHPTTVVGHHNECFNLGASSLSVVDQVGTVHLQPHLPTTIHHQIFGATTAGNFLNLAFGAAAKLTDQPPLLHSPTPTSAVDSVSVQNEKSALVPSVQTGMADESVDQKYFVFNANIQQAMSSPPPPAIHQPPSSTNTLLHSHNSPQLHGGGGGSLNVLSLSAVHHSHHSLHQNALPLACASAASSLSTTMDARHTTAKEQKVSG